MVRDALELRKRTTADLTDCVDDNGQTEAEAEGDEDELRGGGRHHFLLRFSERIAGQFAIAYVAMNKASGEREVKHYLLKPDDIAGPNKTIADFLRVHDKFLFVVEKRLDFAPQPPLVVARHNKDVVLDEFYTKKNFTAIAGYEDELVD